MTDRAARIAILLGLAPFSLAIGVTGAHAASELLGRDPFQIGAGIGTVVIMLVTLWVWRRHVSWSLLRSMSTVSVTMLVLAQIVVWHPIWSSTQCGVDETLRFGQCLSCVGLWSVLCGLIWWNAVLLVGASRRANVAPPPDIRWKEKRIMSRDAARLAVGLALLPLLPGLFLFSGGTINAWTKLPDHWTLWAAYQICSIPAVGIWLWLWRRQVEWTGRRRWATAILAAAVLLVPLSVFLAKAAEQSANRASASGLLKVCVTILWTLPLFVLAAWFAGTAWVWRESPSRLRRPARSAAPRATADSTAPVAPKAAPDVDDIEPLLRCPACGYSLIGLPEVRCPECGWTSTLDDILRRGIAQYAELDGM